MSNHNDAIDTYLYAVERGIVTSATVDIAKIRREAKLEALAEFEKRIKNYYSFVRGNTYAGLVAYHVGVKADEYREEIEREYAEQS